MEAAVRDRNIRLQFSLRARLGVVTIVGSGCAALRNPSEQWVGALFTLTPAVLYFVTFTDAT